MDKATIITIFIFSFILHRTNSNSICDLKKWYLKSLGEGLFDGTLTPYQESIQIEIEDLLIQSRTDPSKTDVDCALIKQAEDILKDKSGNTQNDNKADTHSNDSEIDETDIIEEDEMLENTKSESDNVHEFDQNKENIQNKQDNEISNDKLKNIGDIEYLHENLNNENINENIDSPEITKGRQGESLDNENVDQATSREGSESLEPDNENVGQTISREGSESLKSDNENIGQAISRESLESDNKNVGQAISREGSEIIEELEVKPDNKKKTLENTNINTEQSKPADRMPNDDVRTYDITRENPNKVLERKEENQNINEATSETDTKDIHQEKEYEHNFKKATEDDEAPLGKYSKDNMEEVNSINTDKTGTEQTQNADKIDTGSADSINTDETEQTTRESKGFETTNQYKTNNNAENNKDIKSEERMENNMLTKGQEVATTEQDKHSEDNSKVDPSIETNTVNDAQMFGKCERDRSSVYDVFTVRYFQSTNDAKLGSHIRPKLQESNKNDEQISNSAKKAQETNTEEDLLEQKQIDKTTFETVADNNDDVISNDNDEKSEQTDDSQGISTILKEDTNNEDENEQENTNQENNREKISQEETSYKEKDKWVNENSMGESYTAPAAPDESNKDVNEKDLDNSKEQQRNKEQGEGSIGYIPQEVQGTYDTKSRSEGHAHETNGNKASESHYTSSHDQTEKPTFNIEAIEQLFKSKTIEYSSKIQNLEILIMKLENQLLVEKLDKQNHSSTITRLENSILKLENELLKLDNSHKDMKAENEKLNKQRKTYLELDHIPHKSRKQRRELADQSVKNTEIITEQQNQIFQLAELLKNQSKAINQMKSKYEYLEDQNRMLFQMVMNQTSLMTQIMSRVQELSDQNIQHRIEAQNLKEKLASSKTADQTNNQQSLRATEKLLEKLDAIVSDKKLDMEGTDTNIKPEKLNDVESNSSNDESDENLKEYVTKTNRIIDFTNNWCKGRNTICLFKTIRLAKCVPFVPVYWSVCEAIRNKETLPKPVYVHDKKRNQKKDGTKRDNTKLQDSGAASSVEEIDTGTENVFIQENDNSIIQVSVKSTDTKTESENQQNAQVKEKEQIVNSDKTNENAENKYLKEQIRTNSEQENVLQEVSNSQSTQNAQKDIKELKTKESVKSTRTKEPANEKMDAKRRSDLKEPGDQNGHKKVNEDKTLSKMSEKSNTDKPLKFSNKAQENEKKDAINQKKLLEKQDNKQPQKRFTIQGKEATKQQPDNIKDWKIQYEKGTQTEPKDCYDYYLMGQKRNTIYKVRPYGLKKTIQVYCDMKGGGWTLVQKRSDGTTKFFKEWEDYKTGFGGLYGEHWLGNDYIHYLTNQDEYKLRIDITDWNKTKKFAEYNHFSIEDEKEGYKLAIYGYSGDAGDGMAKHNGHKFSTKDVDNDKVVKEFGGSCAKRFSGAWWYYKCYMSNLNGIYYRNGQIPHKMFDGITWKPWTGPNYSLRSVEMKIRPVSAIDNK